MFIVFCRFSSFVSSRAALLLDLSLFVSSENYSNLTRPTYSQLYPWPLQYFVLPNLRHAAKARTAHLGFSSLDLDVEQEGDSGGQDRNSQYKSLIPESLRSAVGREPTVTGFLKAQRASSQFGLEALVAELCDPLVELLGSQQYLFSSRLPPSQDGSDVGPTSLDCLVAGYFALMLNADVPSSWLRDGIKRRYPSLVSYIDTLTGCFQDTHDSTKANSGSKLPWADAPTSKLNRSSIWEQIATSVLPPLPFISSSVQTRPTQLSTPKSHHLETPNDAVSPPDSSISRRTAIMATTTVLGLGLGLGLAMATSNTSFFPNHILPTYNHTFFTSFLPFMSSSSSSAAAANDDNNNGNGAGHYFPSSSQNRGSNSNNTSTNSNNSNRKTRFEDYGEAGALLSSAIGGSAGVENPRI